MGSSSSILTKLQKRFLELVVNEPSLLKKYYWTGGTVLSEFYLHHRDSEDIDLFTTKEEVQINPINVFMKNAANKIGAEEISYTQFLGLHTYVIKFRNNTILKVDFNYYPFTPLEKGGIYKKLTYDSLIDIAVNKFQTIATKPRGRDFIDLYLINKTYGFKMEDLAKKARSKFDWYVNPIQLAANFLLAKESSDLPIMRIPLKNDEWRKYFLHKAKDLKSEVF